MSTNELIRMIFGTLTLHIPPSATWIPLAVAGAVALFGLLLMVRGARLAVGLACVTFFVLGGLASSFAADRLGTPVWPTIAAGAVVAGVIGLAFFRIWQALLLAGCASFAGLALYYSRVLQGPVANFTIDNFDRSQGLVTLPGAAGAEVPASTTAQLSQLWSYLGQNVPNFEMNFALVTLITALAGLLFGLLLPRASRALWTATLGTLCLVGGLTALLEMLWPEALAWLMSLGAWGWAAVGTVWVGSVIYNFAACCGPRPKKPEPAAPQTRPAVA